MIPNVKKELWGEATYATTCVLNRNPTSALNGACMEHALQMCDIVINVRLIRIFGSMAYAHIPKKVAKGKLDAISRTLLLMG